MDGHLILDRYRPLEQLGEGGFGTVVLAWDTRMQRRVAIKRLPLAVGAPGADQPAGLAEARTVALLAHPNIATVHDFDTDEDEAFLIMEYVDGLSLADLMHAADGPLTLDEVAAVADAVGSALSFAHDNGVLHLDLKPDNILVMRDGRVKVTDFGISELSTLSGHASAGGGTPGYMPLEQLLGREVDERTDQWAFAATLFELLAGENPFYEPTPEAALVRLETRDVPSLAQFQPDYPLELSRTLDIALSPLPEDRFETVSEFIDEALKDLGDPGAGDASLRELVEQHSEELEEEPAFDEIGLWDRLSGRTGQIALRGTAALETSWLAWIGLSRLGLEESAVLAAVALTALGAALAPSLGLMLGLGCLIAGLLASSLWVAAAVVAVGGAVWWWFVARHAEGASVLPLAAPTLGALRVAPLQPLIAGFALRPWPAAWTALAGGMLTMLASAVSYESVPYLAVSASSFTGLDGLRLGANAVETLVTDPGTWIALAGWPLAAAAMSLACERATRFAAATGVVLGTLILGAAYVAAYEFAGSGWFRTPTALALVASLILGMSIVFLGPPLRAEED